MRPGARGFLKVVIGLAVSILAFIIWTTVTEFGTLAEDDPISHFLSELGPLGGFLYGNGFGFLAASMLWIPIAFAFHFWWPAKSRWKLQDEAIALHGKPGEGMPCPSYKRMLWEIHTAKGE